MKENTKELLSGWLIHTVILLLAINIFDSIDYLTRVRMHGVFYRNEDGSPISLWQRLIIHNFRRPDNLYLLLFTLLVETHHVLLFNRTNWMRFLGTAVLLSAVSVFFFSWITGSEMNVFRAGASLCGYLIAYSLVRSFLKHRLYSQNVRLSNSENELSRIKQQINPHFLFNTLNYIYGTALQENAEKTSRAIEMLSGMMRQSLEGLQEDYVSLSREITFIENYIELVKARFISNDKVSFKIAIEKPEEPYQIAPMLLMPFIENAFKFGVQHEVSPYVNLSLFVKEGVLKLRVENAVSVSTDIAGTNSGLALTRQRLKLIYSGKYHLAINNSTENFTVSLDVQLK